MEFIDKIELQGIVGQVHTTNVGDREKTQISMCTNYAYEDLEGKAIIETTWFNVVAWDIPNAKNAKKGDRIHVLGRLRVNRFTGSDGAERLTNEVVARRVAVAGEEAK